MSDVRTELQCAARGCDGCVVCDRDNFTKFELIEYRKKEALINDYIKSRLDGLVTARP